MRLSSVLRRTFFAIIAGLVTFCLHMNVVAAVTQSDINAIIKDTPFYDSDESSSTCGPGQTATSGYDPLVLTYPAFPDEAAVATAITSRIAADEPSSPWLTIPDVGKWLLNESKTRNINPLFVFGSGKIESQFGTSPPGRDRNNFFGIDLGRRSFDSVTEGMVYFLDHFKTNTQGGNPIYSQAKNVYEIFAIHQAGLIVYPGEDFDPDDRDLKPGVTKDSWDDVMKVWRSWDPNRNKDNPRPDRRGQYNPLIYYKVIIELINGTLGLTLPADNPSRSSGSACANGVGNVDASGYAFPLEPQTKAIGGIKVGQTETMHVHDNTPAFDLTSPIKDADVYALYGGTPVKVNTSEDDVEGCTAIQFLADDGFYYWYGHLKNPVVEEDKHIDAGTKMAEVADYASLGKACVGGAEHLHIDRGCTINGEPQPGGYDDCRDPAFIPLLSKVYEGLP